ncbi:hypothetical protein THRCLA_05625 [Thraustotheca clavata]|uniref:Uncharacterized protein n=1 Tax=Thraustotheca clavata TaxID=74557 RepID=A0A1V9ZVF4_9STRA|nr:hypothetical protein THRCLA_05625 [Thraustotheca clavata]
MEPHNRPELNADFLTDDLWGTVFNEPLPGQQRNQGTTENEWDSIDGGLHESSNASFSTSPSTQSGPITLPIHPNGGSLSKPVFRHDGLLVVGTEASGSFNDNHRLFLTNFRSNGFDSVFLPLTHAVRDILWIQPNTIAIAIAKDLQVMSVGQTIADCQLHAPLTMIHSDIIRELAVSPLDPRHILSGGFDETVCMTDLEALDVLLKFDARDVVSSLRWLPDHGILCILLCHFGNVVETQNHISWTTDGGNFSIADIRVKSASGQLSVDCSSLFRFDVTGGLFSHEYTSSCNHVALAYENGYIAFLDTRMLSTRSPCYMMCSSPLRTIGEIRKSLCGDYVLFGIGGFAVADLGHITNPATHFNIDFNTIPMETRKTSGDFAADNVNLLAVSDSVGLVSVYDMQHLRRTDQSTFTL